MPLAHNRRTSACRSPANAPSPAAQRRAGCYSGSPTADRSMPAKPSIAGKKKGVPRKRDAFNPKPEMLAAPLTWKRRCAVHALALLTASLRTRANQANRRKAAGSNSAPARTPGRQYNRRSECKERSSRPQTHIPNPSEDLTKAPPFRRARIDRIGRCTASQA